MTKHTLIVGDCQSMEEIADETIHMIITSPPYYNAPHDYKDLYENYDVYLSMLKNVMKELYRVLIEGRIFILNIDDMLVEGVKYPILADAIKLAMAAGFRYRDRITWKKPEGYIRTSRRSGVLIQNPYPMYFYPDNLLESIIIFQKGRFDYKSISEELREASKISIKEFQDNKWNLTLWPITNVLPNAVLEKGIAAFPKELPYRMIKLFSYVGETILDPFSGSGTSLYVARDLDRNSVGIEINLSQAKIIKEKMKFRGQMQINLMNEDEFQLIIRK